MIIRILLLLLVLAATSVLPSRKKTSTNHSTARPAGRIIVDVDFGTIDVSAGADDKISVVAHRKIDSDNEAQEKEYLHRRR